MMVRFNTIKMRKLDGYSNDNREASIEWCIENGYKIPKWLLEYNIRCPFVKANLFKASQGIINYNVVGDVNGPLVCRYTFLISYIL